MNQVPKSFCAAPWTHTYASPQGERRLCCASREEASWQKQYIDVGSIGKADEFSPLSLSDHWNSEKMKRIRLQMVNGEFPNECQVCNENILNVYTYKKYFNETLFPQKLDELIRSTNEDGSIDYLPVSFDYRISNLCNFICRMCGEQLSSSWESEKRKYNQWDPNTDKWMIKSNKEKLDSFSAKVLEKELWLAVKEKTIEEIYWVGGEPLMWDIHWEVMTYINENYSNEEKSKVTIRYNSNLSRIKHPKNPNADLNILLKGFKSVNFCASLDGTADVGEYIRTGLEFNSWQKNFESLLFLNEEYGENGLVLDITLTSVGLLFIEDLFFLAKKLSVKSYIKTVFAFDSAVLLSPLAFPRDLLNSIIDEKLEIIKISGVNSLTEIFIIALEDLKTKQTFSETYSETENKKNKKIGRSRLDMLDRIRGTNIREFLSINPKVLEWWENE